MLFSCETPHITSKIGSFSIDKKDLISKVNSNNINYKWLDLKGGISFQSESQTGSLNIKIANRKDSLIWFSARGPFGIEIFSGQITKDTISFIDRINKTYFHQPFERIKEVVNTEFSFYKIQEIITANPKISNMQYKLEYSDTGFYLNSKKEIFFITKDYKIEEAAWIINEQKIELSLKGHKPPHNFPEKISLKIENQDSFSLSINVSEVRFFEFKKIVFKIPYSYVEIE